MKAAWILGLSLVLTAPGLAADDFSARVLATQNAERAALGIAPLAWSDALAADAAVWARHLADTGSWGHADAVTRKGEGENLWEGTAGAFDPAEMVGGWAGEKRYYHYGPFPDGGLSDGQPIGHYTQMIWRNTTDVGCALATGHGKDVLVCRYAPMGNIVGQTPY
jgi:uncharacterized protein YkwD